MVSRLVLAVALSLAGSSAAVAKPKEPSLRDRQQAACFNDAQRLCGEFIPDVDKVTVCMAGKKAEVSAGCAAIYDEKS